MLQVFQRNGNCLAQAGPLGTEEDSNTEAKAPEYKPSPEKQAKTQDDSCG